MPTVKTEVTEIVTGLATLPFATVEEALAARPTEIINVEVSHWDRLNDAYAGQQFHNEFTRAWSNGKSFLEAEYGLRHRTARRVEWKGPHQTPGYDLIPADLRIDHVFLISCKYLSRILFNASPFHLFERALATRRGTNTTDWYSHVANEAFQSFYSAVRDELQENSLPGEVSHLSRLDRDFLKTRLSGPLSASLEDSYMSFCRSVSLASADVWNSHLRTLRDQEEMLWRLLRLASAPYFVLGTSNTNSIRLRVYTPWDWRQEFTLEAFRVWGDQSAGQPLVRWRAIARTNSASEEFVIDGHVEVRWSHGRFSGNPEAKVYLDTPHDQVPGYAVI
ncbi:MAG: hypothetical protein WD208_02940 [Dehalococcoidia bacterium]